MSSEELSIYLKVKTMANVSKITIVNVLNKFGYTYKFSKLNIKNSSASERCKILLIFFWHFSFLFMIFSVKIKIFYDFLIKKNRKINLLFI